MPNNFRTNNISTAKKSKVSRRRFFLIARLTTPMHTFALDHVLRIIGDNANRPISVVDSKVKYFITGDAECVYLERSQAKAQTQTKELILDMLQLSNSAKASGVKTASVFLLDTDMAEIFS